MWIVTLDVLCTCVKMAILSSWQYAAAAAILAVLLLVKYVFRENKALAHVPNIRFKGSNSIKRYLFEADQLLHEGYIKVRISVSSSCSLRARLTSPQHTKEGRPFQLRSAIDPTKQVVVLPLKYLNEVKTAPQDKFSFPKFSRESFRVHTNHAPLITEEAQNSMKAELPRNLGPMVGALQDASAIAIHDSGLIPDSSGEWTKVRPFEAITVAIIRMAHRALAGGELGTSEEWVRMVRHYLQKTNDAIVSSNIFFPGPLGYLAPYLDPNVRAVARILKSWARLLQPTYDQRLALAEAGGRGEGETDGLDWLMAASKRGPKDIDGMINDLGFLTIASVETTASTILNILYDLVDNPSFHSRVMEEIRTVQATLDGGRWTKKSLDELEYLDSLMKESQRLRPLGMGAVHRSTSQTVTFKDGLSIPPDTQVLFPTHEICHDDDFYPDAATFDPERWLKMRHTGNPGDHSKFQFSYISDTYVTMGAGTHACPGRALASAEIKLVLVHMLQRWEMRYGTVDGKRPAVVPIAFSRIPDAKADMLFREREEWRERNC